MKKTRKNVLIFKHPLIQHKIAILRNKETGPKEFRELVKELCQLMCYEVTRDLPTVDVMVETPIGTASSKMLSCKVCIVAILRAGLGMVDGGLQLIPTARVGHVGLYRDESSHKPVEYYCKLPKDVAESEVLVFDPMLATGGSASAAIQLIKDAGVDGGKIKFLALVAATAGIDRVTEDHPDISVFVADEDKELNENDYIVPGLGDAGDRLFGTK